MTQCILSSAYLAPISYYRQLVTHDTCLIEVMDNYQKQSYRNRCIIAHTNGLLPLTIPVEKPQQGKCHTRDIRISDHGRWRHLHWNALCSAYRNTPYFEYYADDFIPFYEQKWTFLADYNEALLQLICQLLDIHPKIQRTATYCTTLPAQTEDLREQIHPRKTPLFHTKPYYQVFSQKTGFCTDLSIVDLLFNMGPEAVLYIL